jgi:hypothetical protein
MAKRVFITGGTGLSNAFCRFLAAHRNSSAACAGTNGPFVCKALVAAGHHVVALVRNPDKPEAAELRGLGVELLLGDTKCDSLATLSRAAWCFAVVCARSCRVRLQRSDAPRHAANGQGRDLRLGGLAQCELGELNRAFAPLLRRRFCFIYCCFPGRFLGRAAHQKERSSGAECFMVVFYTFFLFFHAQTQKLEATSSAPNTKGFIFSGGVAGSWSRPMSNSNCIALHCIALHSAALHCIQLGQAVKY